jgi:glutamine synthetase
MFRYDRHLNKQENEQINVVNIVFTLIEGNLKQITVPTDSANQLTYPN